MNRHKLSIGSSDDKCPDRDRWVFAASLCARSRFGVDSPIHLVHGGRMVEEMDALD